MAGMEARREWLVVAGVSDSASQIWRRKTAIACFVARKLPVSIDSQVPKPVGGENREPTFARDARSGEADIRYTLAIFLPRRLLCSGNRHWQ